MDRRVAKPREEGKKISVVMPVQDTGERLKECIESVIRQEYKNWELICVDDGSKDQKTREYLMEFCLKEERIKCIRSETRIGAANARNEGLAHTSGEYIICLDSDDIFFPDMFSEMVASLEQWDAELCICDFASFDDKSGLIWEETHLRHATGITDGAFQLGQLGERGLLYWWMSPWEALCKRSLLERNEIRFQDIPCCNDIYFSVMCAQRAEKIAYAGEGRPLMKYRTGRGDAISKRRHPKYAYEAVKVVADQISDTSSLEYRQLMVFLVECSMVLFFEYEKDDAKEYYDFLRKLISENIDAWDVEEEDSRRRMGYFIHHDYESKWFKQIADGGEYW